MPIPSSELILRPDGAIYHINLRPEDLIDTIITVGDPERVEMISRHFDQLFYQRSSREIIAHGGRIGGKDLLVLSTGMGTDNIEIVFNELDALANIDLESREIRTSFRQLSIIRIGTSGSIHPDVPVNSLLASASGTGLDSLMHFYNYNPGDYELAFSEKLAEHLSLGFIPYHAPADQELLVRLGNDMLRGHTLTCPGFYAPQGRSLRLAPRNTDFMSRIYSFVHEGISLTNIEMETAAMYALGSLLGHRVLSLNAIIADRRNGKFSSDGHAVVERLIAHVLEKIETI